MRRAVITDPQGRQFTFNGDNKQTEVRDSTNNVIGTYSYDGDGKRIKKITNAETTTFVYSGGKLVAEYQLTNNTPTTATTQYLGTDMLGSPRVVSDQTGVVVSRRDFMPFGEDLTRANYGIDSIRQKFTGYERDSESGLDFAEARYYNSSIGRFTAVDPLLASGKSANPQTFNRYAYTGNNPLSRADPGGTDWYKVTNKRVTYGGTYTSEQAVWRSKRERGDKRWDRGGVFKITNGKYAGQYTALNPYAGESARFSSRGAAEAQYNTYLAQRNADAIGGAVNAVADTVDSVSPGTGGFGVHRRLAGAALSLAGITPNESSDVYRVSNRATHSGIIIASVVAGDVAPALLESRTANSGSKIVVNLGGEGEVPGAINQNTDWILDPSFRASRNRQTLAELQAEGHQFIVSSNTDLPFANSSVDTVFTNSVPIDTSNFSGPGVQTTEINRILKPNGTWFRDGSSVPR